MSHRKLPTVGFASALAARAFLDRSDGQFREATLSEQSQTPSPDFRYTAAPESCTGAVYKLSQDYPAKQPDKNQLPAFFNKFPKMLSSDFGPWRDYLMRPHKADGRPKTTLLRLPPP